MELNTSGASNCSSENKYFLYSSIDRTLDTHAAFGTEHKRVKASLKPERRRGRDGEVGAEAGGAEGGGHDDDDVDVFLYCQHIKELSENCCCYCYCYCYCYCCCCCFLGHRCFSTCVPKHQSLQLLDFHQLTCFLDQPTPGTRSKRHAQLDPSQPNGLSWYCQHCPLLNVAVT